MNFYDFHIGDYASRTAHLDPMEDLAYRRLLDLYYVREKMLPFDPIECARLIRMKDHQAAVKTVLLEFFVALDDGKGWAHDRCERVIAAATDKRTKAQASAALRWDNERNANAIRTHSEGNAPSPSPSPKKNTRAIAPTPDGVSDSVWKDFLKTRKTALTDTALKDIRREAGKARMTLEQALEMACERGWRSFKAVWLENGKASPTSTVPGRQEPDPELQRIKNHKGAAPSMETLARMAELRKPNLGAH